MTTYLESAGVKDIVGTIILNDGFNSNLKKDLNQVGAFSDPIALPLYPFVNEKFVYGTVPNIDHIVTDTSGGGNVSIANGLITLSTGAAINRTAYFRTRRPVIYSAGIGCHARFTVILSATGTGKYREWGVGTLAATGAKPSSAIYFKDNAGAFSLNVRKANSDILTVNRANWIDKLDGTGASGLNLANFTTGAPLEIVWPYLGFGDVYFYLIESGVKHLIATIHVTGVLTTPFIENPTLYPYGFVENTTANTDTTLSFGSIGGLLEFDFSKAVGVNYDTSLVSKAAITTETPILSIYNPLNAFGGTNNNGIVLKLTSYTASSDGTGSANCDLQFYLHSSAVTGGSYADLLANRSVIQVNTAPTSFSTANQRRVHAHSLDRPTSAVVDTNFKNILIYPGEYLTVTGTSGTAFTGVVSLGFQEFQ